MSKGSEMVGEFIQCGEGTGYDVVQLLAALDLDSSHQLLDHWKMTVGIRYKTPYFMNKRDPFSFLLLWDTMFPSIVFWDYQHCYPWVGILIAFPLILDLPGKGLPEGIVSDNITPIIPQGVSTNVKPNPSFLHYTSAEGRAFYHSSPTYSDNIIVHNKKFEGNVSKELEYKPH